MKQALPREYVRIGPRGLFMLTAFFGYEQLVLFWLPILLFAEASPSSGSVMSSLFLLAALMLVPVGIWLAFERATPLPRRLAMFFCAGVATVALFVTDAGDPLPAVGMVSALLMAEVMLVLRPHAGVTTWPLTIAYLVAIGSLYATIVWGTVLMELMTGRGFTRPQVPSLISWYVVHVWALIGLGRTRFQEFVE